MKEPINTDEALAIHEAWMTALSPEAHKAHTRHVEALITTVNGAVATYVGQHPEITHHDLIEAHLVMLGFLEACILAEQRPPSTP